MIIVVNRLGFNINNNKSKFDTNSPFHRKINKIMCSFSKKSEIDR